MFGVPHSVLFAVLGLVSLTASADDIFVRQDVGQSVVISNVPSTDGFSLLIADPQKNVPTAGLRHLGGQTPQSNATLPTTLLARAKLYVPLVDEVARENRLDARLLHAVIAAESAYNPAARSPKGAVGIMQLLPATARRFGVADSLDARQNIQGGARYLAHLLQIFQNDTQLALAAYNAGEYAVWRYGGKIPPYRETVDYVPRVMGFYRRFESVPL